MKLVLAEVAPVRGELEANLRRLEETLAQVSTADLVVFPELFLSGYRVGEPILRMGLGPQHPAYQRLAALARERRTWLAVGTPWAHPERAGETQNAALLLGPGGERAVQPKRYLPNFGPFEEALHLSPGDVSAPLPTPWGPWGLQICYDVFFPEVSRELALKGAQFLLVLSASPTTSRRMFERLLAARAIENGCSVAFCNRTGVEDGMVFAGGSGLWDARGEPVPPHVTELAGEQRLLSYEVAPDDSALWRPLRPVLRDLASHPRP